jgi:hypothetical protein
VGDTQTGDLINLLSFLENRPKKKARKKYTSTVLMAHAGKRYIANELDVLMCLFQVGLPEE